MQNFVKQTLLSNGVSNETIAILEDQQLVDVPTILEVDIPILIACGIKAGQGIKVKTLCKNLPNESQRVDLTTKTHQDEDQIPSTFLVDVDECNLIDPCISNGIVYATPKRESCSPTSSLQSSSSSKTPSPFVFEEKTNRNVLSNFKLSELKFSPAVTYSLENKTLSVGPLRSEFIRDICTNISAKGLNFLTKSERDKVAMEIITTYPDMKDEVGSGLGSWSEAIKNRFKHVRRYDVKKRERATSSCASLTYTVSPEQPKKQQKVIEAKHGKFWNIIPSGSECLSAEVQADHKFALEKETRLPQSRQDVGKIRELMKSTFSIRRTEILSAVIPVRKITKDYQPLSTGVGICQEFGRIIGRPECIRECRQLFNDKYSSAIVKYARQLQRKTPFLKSVMRSLDLCISKEPMKSRFFETTCAVILLPTLLKGRGTKSSEELADSIVEVLNDDLDEGSELVQASTFPRLVVLAAEELCKIDVVSLCVEGEKLCNAPAMALDTSLLMLHASYYVFNIAYPAKWKDTFIFIDCVLLGIKEAAVKRIGLQKFISGLHKL